MTAETNRYSVKKRIFAGSMSAMIALAMVPVSALADDTTATATNGNNPSVTVQPYSTSTVTFIYDNGDVDGTVVVANGQAVIAPAVNPTLQHKNFLGWYEVDANGELSSTPYDFTAPVQKDTTLKAKWGNLAQVMGHSMDMTGRLDLNTYLLLDSQIQNDDTNYQIELWNGAKMINAKLVSDIITARKSVDGKSYKAYRIDHTVTSFDIDAAVSLRVKDLTTGTYLDLSDPQGNNVAGDAGYAYSIENYLDEIRATATPEMQKLADAIHAYGYYADLYFANPQTLFTQADAPQGYEEVYTSDLFDYTYQVPSPIDHFTFEGASLNLMNDTSFRLYFHSDDADQLLIKCGGFTLKPIHKQDDLYFVELKGIAAQDLDDMYTFEISNGVQQKTTAKHGPLGVAYWTLSNSKNKNLCNLMGALYRYNQAAEAYANSVR